MPCSASTAAGEAASTSATSIPYTASAPRSLRSSSSRGIALADRLVKPLVIQCAFERVQLLPEFLGMRGGDARVEGLAVAPGLNQREVVRTIVLLQHVEPQIAVVLSRRRGEGLLQLDCLILLWRRDIDVG